MMFFKKTWECPVCGLRQRDSVRFCPKCGHQKRVHRDRYDVFICYRRGEGGDVASVLQLELDKNEKTVFLDVIELQVGRFDEQLLDVIQRSDSFILILSQGCLDRCVNETDWLKREVLHALALSKRIIPVFLPGFAFPDERTLALLPEPMRVLPNLQAVEYDSANRELAIRKILNAMTAPVQFKDAASSPHGADRSQGHVAHASDAPDVLQAQTPDSPVAPTPPSIPGDIAQAEADKPLRQGSPSLPGTVSPVQVSDAGTAAGSPRCRRLRTLRRVVTGVLGLGALLCLFAAAIATFRRPTLHIPSLRSHDAGNTPREIDASQALHLTCGDFIKLAGANAKGESYGEAATRRKAARVRSIFGPIFGTIYDGARGNTATEMASAFDFGRSPRGDGRSAIELGERLPQESTLLLAENAFAPSESFEGLIGTRADIRVERADFLADPERAVLFANGWLDEAGVVTDSKMVSPKDVTKRTQFILLRSFRLGGSWVVPFSGKLTHDMDFYLSKEKRVEVPTMRQPGVAVRYTKGLDGTEILELPYDSGDLGLIIVAPPFGALLDQIDPLTCELFPTMRVRKMSIELPRFAVQGDSEHLTPSLKQLGLAEVLREGKADLSGIAGLAGDLYVHRVYYRRTPLKVAEDGIATGATQTALVIARSDPQVTIPGFHGARFHVSTLVLAQNKVQYAKVLYDSKYVGFTEDRREFYPAPSEGRVNRPFFFLLRHRASGKVLLSGRVTNPLDGAKDIWE